ncbi:MAG: DNA glycosylase AlkZ-like family protein, partial [Solirubrobacteraceae bacterium]
GLLPAFDPYLLGWKDRMFAIDPAHARRVHQGGGILRASAVANGRAIATWTAPRGVVELDPFAPLAPAVAAALRREAASVDTFCRGSGPVQVARTRIRGRALLT